MAITFVNFNSATTATATLTVTKPTSTTTDDFLIAVVSGFRTGADFTIVNPSGWTELWEDSYNNGGDIQRVWIGWLKAGGSEPANYAWTGTTWTDACGAISCYRGVDTSSPIDASGRNINSAAAVPTAPTISPATSNAMLLYLVGSAATSPNTAPGGMTERVDTANGANDGVYMADEQLAASGPTGTRLGTVGTNGDNSAANIALRTSSGITPSLDDEASWITIAQAA